MKFVLQNKKETGTDILHGVCAALYCMPLSLCVGVLSGIGVHGGAAVGMIGCLASVFGGGTFVPCWMLFMPAFFAVKEFGNGFAFAAMLIGALLFALVECILQRKNIKLQMTDGAVAGLALGAAFLATVILTKDYFGIAASGNTAIEMLQSYRSNGFHANWRGVLYGTITLVIMITWPRKFRTFKKYLPAPFMALLIPLAINMILNYEAYRTPVYEVGAYNIAQLQSLFDFSANPHSMWLLLPAAVGFCVCFLAVSLFLRQTTPQKKSQTVSHLLTSPFCLPLRPYEFGPKTVLGAAVGAAVVFLLCSASPIISRIPTHSCAVVLITLGWQNVPWGKIKSAFTNGLGDALAFLLTFAVFVIADPIVAFLPPVVSVFDNKKKKTKQ